MLCPLVTEPSVKLDRSLSAFSLPYKAKQQVAAGLEAMFLEFLTASKRSKIRYQSNSPSR